MITRNELISEYLSPIKSLFDQENITDIYVDRYNKISVKINNVIESTVVTFNDEADLNEGLQMLARSLGDQFSEKHPLLAARLPDGARVSATHISRCPSGTSCSIRIHRSSSITLNDLYRCGTLTEEMYAFLKTEMINASNILFSGPTGSGKTTLLDILISVIPTSERIIRVEDTSELQDKYKFGVGYESLEKNSAGNVKDPVLLHHLVRHVLRNDANRLLVGEMRDSPAASAFLRSMSTGHKGACSTIHANNAKNAFMNFVIMVCGSDEYHQVPFERLVDLAFNSISLIVHMNEFRLISEIMSVDDGKFKTIYHYDNSLKKHVLNDF